MPCFWSTRKVSLTALEQAEDAVDFNLVHLIKFEQVEDGATPNLARLSSSLSLSLSHTHILTPNSPTPKRMFPEARERRAQAAHTRGQGTADATAQGEDQPAAQAAKPRTLFGSLAHFAGFGSPGAAAAAARQPEPAHQQPDAQEAAATPANRQPAPPATAAGMDNDNDAQMDGDARLARQLQAEEDEQWRQHNGGNTGASPTARRRTEQQRREDELLAAEVEEATIATDNGAVPLTTVQPGAPRSMRDVPWWFWREMLLIVLVSVLLATLTPWRRLAEAVGAFTPGRMYELVAAQRTAGTAAAAPSTVDGTQQGLAQDALPTPGTAPWQLLPDAVWPPRLAQRRSPVTWAATVTAHMLAPGSFARQFWWLLLIGVPVVVRFERVKGQRADVLEEGQ